MSIENLEVEQIVADLKNGNNKILGEIYNHCQLYCHGYLRKKFDTSKEDFKDIYSDALMVFRRNMIAGKVKNLNNIRSYILTICINLVKKELTSKSRAQKKVEQIRLLFTDISYNLNDYNDQEVMIVNVKKALNKLTEKCIQILTSYYVHNMSMKEIVDEYGFSNADVVKTSKSRCLKKWRTEYFSQKNDYDGR